MRKLVIDSGAVLLMIFALVCVAQSDRPQQRPPNIVFILVDDLRWDDFGAAGHPFVKTPHIDSIGSEGALFRNACITASLCSPSRASFLTGQYPHTHRLTANINRSASSHQLRTFPIMLARTAHT